MPHIEIFTVYLYILLCDGMTLTEGWKLELPGMEKYQYLSWSWEHMWSPSYAEERMIMRFAN